MELLEIKLINAEDFADMLLRFCINLFVCFFVVNNIYRSKKKSFTFTYYTLSTLVFILCFLLANVKIELGFALGLFAIFGIIRYRTSLISIKEMTYLFAIIGIAVFNALTTKKVSWIELMFANVALVSVMYIKELVVRPGQKEKCIKYDNVTLLHADKKLELYADIEQRLGIEVINVEIGSVNYIKDSAELTVYYKDKK